MTRGAVPASLAVAAIAFVLYRSTVLPGVELGDSASFQVMVGSPVITPRDGYPLYFAIADAFHFLAGGEPARALNLMSVVEGAVASGLIALVAIELSGAVMAGAAAALMFAASYTFWSQSIIAEVYALHILLVTLTLLLALRWQSQPTSMNLFACFAAYALAFGNHLTMILLAPSLALFMFLCAPGGWRTMLSARVMLLAAAAAAAGAAQYGWNLAALWLEPAPPASWRDALGTFWFDVTKADWRDTMVLRVPAQMAAERLRMYLFDVQQQFGWFELGLAILGLYALVRDHPRRAALAMSCYLVNVLFALAYNVGDSHVFFLPSHLMLALLAAPGIARLGQSVAAPTAVVSIALVLVAARIYRDYPALDRSDDRRPSEALEALTSGLDDRQAILVADLNWQLQNGLNYFARFDRPQVAFARLPDVALYAPALVEDNLRIGRDVIATERAMVALDAAYGPLTTATLDASVPLETLADTVEGLRGGTRYVLCYIRQSGEFVVDDRVLSDALVRLTGGVVASLPPADLVAMAGTIGQPPALLRASDRPFRDVVMLDGVRTDVRMESWLAFDTIRRMGFGQVVAGRSHALIVERGISFVALDAAGRAIETAYDANIFMPQRRYLITTNLP